MSIKPNYYAIIPAEIRYENQLSANEKLMYGEITALANNTGECWASNAYFAGLYDKDVRTITRWISHLEKLGFIDTKLHYKKNSKEVDKRIITLSTKMTAPYGQKCPDPLGKNVGDNNTSNNNTSIINEELFESLWKDYGCKGTKRIAKKYWSRLSKKDHKAIADALPKYIEVRPREYRKDFQGWINPDWKRWEDEIEVKDERMKI
jgi:hypothetical protein